jgi:hypothetical protein
MHYNGTEMIVGFTTTYAIGAYHHWCCEFESRSGRGVQHYVIKFVRMHYNGTEIDTNIQYQNLHAHDKMMDVTQ